LYKITFSLCSSRGSRLAKDASTFQSNLITERQRLEEKRYKIGRERETRQTDRERGRGRYLDINEALQLAILISDIFLDMV
jgi:hypothetical protein